MIGTIFSDILIEIPQVFLALHALDCSPFFVPNFSYVQERSRLPFHLLRLVWFKQIKLWRTEHLLLGIVTPGLRDHPTFQRELSSCSYDLYCRDPISNGTS